jgi:hypothetical protein
MLSAIVNPTRFIVALLCDDFLCVNHNVLLLEFDHIVLMEPQDVGRLLGQYPFYRVAFELPEV